MKMPQPKILIVDDDFASRLLLKKALQDENYQLSTCSDGTEALEILNKHRYDLVLTDLVMESVGGLELLEKIKSFDADISVMLLTGYASVETAIEAVRLGAIDYIIKPINISELRMRVKKAFEQLDLKRRLQEAERAITFNATVARANHEINQPLTVIISAVDMVKLELEKAQVENGRVKSYLELMSKASQRIAHILRKMREISNPKIQDIPHGMKMIELHPDETIPLAHGSYILVIEDEENLRKISREMLESEGYKIITAGTGKESIEIFQKDKNAIGLVILDYNLPDANGLEVLESLQKIDPEVRVLLTSGFNVGDEIEEALQRGALDFLSKPFNRNQLLQVVNDLFEKRPRPEKKN